MFLSWYMELAMYFRMRLNVILQREMQSRPSAQMNFQTKRSCFTIKNLHIYHKHCQNKNNHKLNRKHFKSIHKLRCQEKNWNDENDVSIGLVSKLLQVTLTLCIVAHTISKSWIVNVIFPLSPRSCEMRFLPYLNWFLHILARYQTDDWQYFK